MSTPARPAAAHGWRIGSLAGTPVYLGRSWPIIAVLIVVVFGPNLAAARPRRLLRLPAGRGLRRAAARLGARARGGPRPRGAVARVTRSSRIVADVWGGHTVYDATRSSPEHDRPRRRRGSALQPRARRRRSGAACADDERDGPDRCSASSPSPTSSSASSTCCPACRSTAARSSARSCGGRRAARAAASSRPAGCGRVVAVLTVAWFALRAARRGRPPDIFDLVWPDRRSPSSSGRARRAPSAPGTSTRRPPASRPTCSSRCRSSRARRPLAAGRGGGRPPAPGWPAADPTRVAPRASSTRTPPPPCRPRAASHRHRLRHRGPARGLGRRPARRRRADRPHPGHERAGAVARRRRRRGDARHPRPGERRADQCRRGGRAARRGRR